MGQQASCCQEEELDGPKEVIQPEVVSHRYEGKDDEDGGAKEQEVRPTGSQTHEGGHMLMKPMSGTSRLENMKHLEVDIEIIRGISLRRTLQSFGRLWRWSPLDLQEEARQTLWTKSKRVAGFDIFLSHTWMTPGWRKVLTLTLRSGWPVALCFWALGALLAIILSVMDILPMPGTMEIELPGFEQSFVPVGIWVMLIGAVSLLLGLLVSVHLPDACSTSDTCFLDVVSIHQTDPTLMERGIYGLGGFLKVSQELRVLWSPPYLSRLWCVFELAAYKMANPTGKINLHPLFIETVGCWLFQANCVGAAVFHAVRLRKMGANMEYAGYCLGMLASLKAWHRLRKESLNKHKLLSDLENFDVEHADCRSEFDRDFIHAGIIQWYGSKEAFTCYVRGPLKEKFIGTAEFCVHLPFFYILLIATPSVSVGLEGFVAALKAGAPFESLVSHLLGKVIGVNFFWQLMSLKFGMFLCDRYAEPRWGGGFWNGFQTFLICVGYFLCYLIGAVVGNQATGSHIGLACAWMFVSMLPVVCTWRMFKYYEQKTQAECATKCDWNFKDFKEFGSRLSVFRGEDSFSSNKIV